MRGGGGDCRDPFLQGLSLCLQITLPATGKASAEASSRIISLGDSLPPDGRGSSASLSPSLSGLLAGSGGSEPFYFLPCAWEQPAASSCSAASPGASP